MSILDWGLSDEDISAARKVLQAGVCMEIPERNLPVNPVSRDEICALLQEFGQRPGAR